MPVLIKDKSQIFALHIGWRGLAQKILSQTKPLLQSPKQTQIWVGPHIQTQSFELDIVSTNQILKNHNLNIKTAWEQKLIKKSDRQSQHFFVDLKEILHREAKHLGIKNFYSNPLDTHTSADHFSRRRNRFTQRLQYSFIIKT